MFTELSGLCQVSLDTQARSETMSKDHGLSFLCACVSKLNLPVRHARWPQALISLCLEQYQNENAQEMMIHLLGHSEYKWTPNHLVQFGRIWISSLLQPEVKMSKIWKNEDIWNVLEKQPNWSNDLLLPFVHAMNEAWRAFPALMDVLLLQTHVNVDQVVDWLNYTISVPNTCIMRLLMKHREKIGPFLRSRMYTNSGAQEPSR